MTTTRRAFVIMQIGAKGSPERKRADEIYDFVVVPAVKEVDLEAYRADLDFTPGPITSKFLSELLNARLIIADLTGHNPNVFYELGIAHSFACPLISIADSSSSLPFDTKDERIIELGEYPLTGLTYAQGEQAKISLQESLKVVLADGYVPPSPLRELAANASVDQLAPENPIAAEMARMRESLEEIRWKVTSQLAIPAVSDLLEEILMLSRRTDRQLNWIMRSLSSLERDAGATGTTAPLSELRDRNNTGVAALFTPKLLQQIAQETGIHWPDAQDLAC